MQTVIVIEDNLEVGDLIERVVRGLGATRVGRFVAVEEARASLPRFLPVGLFIIDEYLSGLDRGSDFARWLRSQPEMAAVPRICCSAVPDMIALGEDAAQPPLFDCTIRKPFDEPALFIALFRCLRGEPGA